MTLTSPLLYLNGPISNIYTLLKQTCKWLKVISADNYKNMKINFKNTFIEINKPDPWHIFVQFLLKVFRVAQPHYIQNYVLLGSGQISRMTLEMSKTAEFRGSAELLHVCKGLISFSEMMYLLHDYSGNSSCRHELNQHAPEDL